MASTTASDSITNIAPAHFRKHAFRCCPCSLARWHRLCHVSADPPHEGHVAKRSPVSTKQISAAINNVLAKAGLDASESEKVRHAYDVGVDQIDDESDESRKALDRALSKILASDKVKHIDAHIDHVVDIASSIVERDLDASAGSAPVHGGVAAHHETKPVSVDAADDPAYQVWSVKAWDLMATGPGDHRDTERIGPMVRKLQQLFPAYNITPSAVDNKTNTTLDAATDCDCLSPRAVCLRPGSSSGRRLSTRKEI
jgi:hypothetical protein